MDTPIIVQRTPMPIDVEAGKKYFWCSCGKSQKQPFCDGSHKGTSFTPIEYDATSAQQIYFCACKHSKTSPLCDGTHRNLG